MVDRIKEIKECLVTDYGFRPLKADELIEKYDALIKKSILFSTMSHRIAEEIFNQGRNEELFEDEEDWFVDAEGWDLDAEEAED